MVIKVGLKPARPADRVKRTRGDRHVGEQLDAAVAALLSKPSGDWFQIGEFTGRAKQAYWYRARLQAKHSGKPIEFTSSIEKGVGRVFARKAEPAPVG